MSFVLSLSKDLLARTVIEPNEPPVGVLTALLGVRFFSGIGGVNIQGIFSSHMDYHRELEKLEQFRELLEQYDPVKYTSGPDAKRLKNELVEAYGAVEDVIEKFAGRSEVIVPTYGGFEPTVYPNLIEAGFLSGRTFHSHQGFNQLLKVIGKVKTLVADPNFKEPKDEGSISSLVRALSRFRECCHYLKELPRSEREVQDLLWLVLRSHFDRVDREDTLPKFGIKNYRPDFGVPELRVLIEIKFIGEKTSLPTIQEELLADVPGYLQSQSRYDSIIYFVYDGSQKLKDPRKFIDDLRLVAGVSDVLVIPGLA